MTARKAARTARRRTIETPAVGSWLSRPGITQWSFRVPFGVEPMAADVEAELRPWYLRSREAAGVAPLAFVGEHPRDALRRLATEPLRPSWASRWEPDPDQLATVRHDLLETTRRNVLFGPAGGRDRAGLTYDVAPLHLIDPRLLLDQSGRIQAAEFRALEFAELVAVGARAGFLVTREATTQIHGGTR